MSILQYRMGNEAQVCADKEQARYERDALGDLKHGLDLVFDLIAQINKLHPMAAETLIRLLSY